MSSLGLTRQQSRAVFALAGIFGLRLFGLFALLPVMSLATGAYEGATMELMGFTLGIYGLTQGLCQLPFGMLSDRFPRRWVIVAGLILFILGSVIAAEAHSISMLLWGRAIQGAGAVGSSLLALVADLTPETVRHRAMAVVGVMVGLAFILAMILAPLLFSFGGLTLIFWIMAGLGVLAIGVLLKYVPQPTVQRSTTPNIQKQIQVLISDRVLLTLMSATLCLHGLLTLLFLALPQLLVGHLALSANQVSLFYAGALVLMLVGFVPWVAKLDRKQISGRVISQAALCMSIAIACFFLQPPVFVFLILLALFFVGFNILETVLPAATSIQAQASDKGAALGLFSTSQFAGTFLGGSLGGLILARWHEYGILWAALWVALGLYLLGLSIKKC